MSSRACAGARATVLRTRAGSRSRLLGALAFGLVGGSFLPQTHAEEQTASHEDAAAPRETESTLAAQPLSPSQRYERARALAASGATEAALAAFDALLLEFPSDADYLLGRAQMQARLGRNAAAVATAERALAVAPDYEDVWQLRLQLAERDGDDAETAALRSEVAARFPGASWWRHAPAPAEYRRWLSGGFGTDRLSNGAPDWNRHFVRVDWRTAAGETFFGEISRSERLEVSDSALYVGGVWEALPGWQLGATLGVTESPRFLPETDLSLDATRAWTRGWGTTFGIRRRGYMTGDVSSYSFTGERYISDYRIAYRLDRSRLAGGDSALSHSLALTWYASDRRSLGVTLGGGEEIETIGLDRLLRTPVSNVTLSGNETLSRRLALSWWLGTHEQGNFYRRDYAGLSIRIGL